MRPLFLNLSGLHSFQEEQHVDFTKLCKAGVFGIFGPTGSGKSTILDAVTLALYGKVERAKHGIQGIINQNENKVRVKFVFSIGDRVFVAERVYKKDKNNKTSLASCRLVEKAGSISEVIAEKNSDMNSKVEELLGLNFDDFTRAVVLPQGKFAEFLMLKGTDRRLMLQRIFGLERYGEKLLEKVRKKLNERKQEFDIVENRQQELGDVSLESIKQMENELAETKILSEKLELKYKQNNERYEKLKQVRQIQRDLENELEKKKELDKKQEQILSYREKLKLAEAAQQVYPFLKREQLEEEELVSLRKSLFELEKKKKIAEKEVEHRKEVYQRYKHKKEESKVLEIKLSEIEGAIKDKLRCDEVKEKLENYRKRYKELQNQRNKLESDIHKLSKQQKELELEKNRVIKIINEKYVAPDEIEKMQKGLQIWQELKSLNRQLKERESELQRQELEINEIQVKIDELIEEEKQLDNHKRVLEEEITLIEKEILNLERKNLAFVLAQDLKSGMPCPVCGSLEHPNIARSNNEEQLCKSKERLKALEEDMQQALKGLNNITSEKSKFEGQKKMLLEESKKLCTKIEILKADIKQKQKLFEDMCKDFSGIEIERENEFLNKNLKEVEQWQKKRDNILLELDSVSKKLEQLKKTESDVLVELGRVEEEGKAYSERFKELKAGLDEVTGGRDIFKLKREIELKIKDIDDEFKIAEKRFEEAREKAENIRNEYFTVKARCEQVNERLENAKRELKAKLEELGFKTKDEVERELIDDQQRAYLERVIDEFEKNNILNEKAISELAKRLGQDSISEEEWNSFVVEKERVEKEFEKVKKDVHVLEDRINDIKGKRKRWLELDKQKKELEEIISKLKILDELFYANRFVEFVAGERLKHIAINASKHLGELTHYRYTVEIDSSGGFIIRDNANGGALRPVHSLSGGEVFLTSLALALALSEQIQLKGRYPLEFFFLDEGFGTLDRDLLETAMNALERLKARNMMIGIISHVEELKNRIPCYLSVTPATDMSGSKLEIKFN
ncbi:AAA family ATPase [Peptococcaceae bacterium]|nr:AAA family ATPase [Peptococcaceae bacterium]